MVAINYRVWQDDRLRRLKKLRYAVGFEMVNNEVKLYFIHNFEDFNSKLTICFFSAWN